MTISIKVHVNGNYEATCKAFVDGEQTQEVIVGPQEEKYLYHTHGKTNTYEVTEKYLGDKGVTE